MKNLLLDQIKELTNNKLPLVSNLSNAAAVLATTENINWAGFYLVEGNSLYLGPFQGEPACTVIQKGKGVCGKAFEEKKTQIVKNVLHPQQQSVQIPWILIFPHSAENM